MFGYKKYFLPCFSLFYQDEEDSDVEEVEEGGEEEKLSDYWSVLKSTPELRKSKVLL